MALPKDKVNSNQRGKCVDTDGGCEPDADVCIDDGICDDDNDEMNPTIVQHAEIEGISCIQRLVYTMD